MRVKIFLVVIGLILTFSLSSVDASSCSGWSGPNRDCERPDCNWLFIDWGNDASYAPGYTRDQCESICESVGATCAQWSSDGTGKCACSDNGPRDTPGTYEIWSTYCSGGISSCPSPCTPSCSGKVCGDDGCGGSCGSCSSGYTCASDQLSCAVVYGDGIITADEECDDGNLVNGDGCSSTGTIETGYSCTGQPSVCEVDCQFVSANWNVTETIEGTNVSLNVLTNEYCDGQEILFEVFENELVGRDAASVNPSNVFVNGNSATGSWIAEWIDDGVGQGNPEYVFKVSLISNSGIYLDNSGELSVITGNLCSNKTVCSDYLSSTECVSDYCDVADGNVESNNLGLTCGEGGVSCQCEWVGDSCEASYSTLLDGVNIGKCSYTEGGDDNCDDGLLVYSWTANWNWGHDGWVDFNDGPSTNVGDYYSGDGVYYYDPSNQFEGCSEGDTVIECPTNVALPFFEFWQIIIVLGIISGIYFFEEKLKNI